MSADSQEKLARRYHCVGKYQVVSHIAAGGMGVVYKAVDTETGQAVALKILSPTLAANPGALERFRREARHGAKLRQENVVSLYEFGEANGTWYQALEFVDGFDLLEYIRRKGVLDPDEAVSFLIQATRALELLHQHQIVHRDIKPSNFLVTEASGRKIIKLTDLGVARAMDSDEFRVTQDGRTVGTIDYMAPEQARDSGMADIRSDIYSLGCTFYHMLAGQAPFSEGGLAERLFKHNEAEPPDVRQFNPKVPLRVFLVTRRMMAKKPGDRYQTPAELLKDLALLENVPGSINPITPNEAPISKGSTLPTPDSRVGDASPELAEKSTAVFEVPVLPELTPEQRRIAVGQFERAIQIMEKGNLDYAIHLLMNCCKLDPGNLVYRQTLRRFQKANFQNKGRPGPLAWLKHWLCKTRLKAAKRAGNNLKVLEHGEVLLSQNPEDHATALVMAQAADALDLLNLGVWLLEQLWQKGTHTPQLNRALARLYEKRGNFTQAAILWDLVHQREPKDVEALQKKKDLAAKETILRGQYQEATQSDKETD
jgi:serine/threonine protein kinase